MKMFRNKRKELAKDFVEDVKHEIKSQIKKPDLERLTPALIFGIIVFELISVNQTPSKKNMLYIETVNIYT